METQVSPEAFFDSLSLAHKLDNFLDGFKLEEIHLFSYFSSFLFCYAGNSIASWPHRYIANNGFPFSDSISEAITRHIRNGLFEGQENYYSITSRGTDEYNRFKSQSLFVQREELINAACTTSILVPYSDAVRALLSEPDFKKANELSNQAWLNQNHFYAQFKEIIEAMGVDSDNMIIPAVTWVNLLLAKEKEVES